MSPGAIAVTAIIVSGAEGLALIGAAAWLVYHKRIMFAATPKPQAQQQSPAAGGTEPGRSTTP